VERFEGELRSGFAAEAELSAIGFQPSAVASGMKDFMVLPLPGSAAAG
jgi:hypothetical protein